MNQTDIKNVSDAIIADLKMIALKTDLWTPEQTDNYAEDIRAFLDHLYLTHIYLILKDENQRAIKARRYDITNSSKLKSKSDLPGDNNWDQYKGKDLSIVISYGHYWHSLSTDEKKVFMS